MTTAPAYWQPIADAMTEDALESNVRALVKDLGLLGFHVWRQHARRAASGFPDWCISGPGGHIFRELKTETGKVTEAQQAWLDTLTAGGADARVWRPTQLLDGTVARELAGIAAVRVAAALPGETGEPA